MTVAHPTPLVRLELFFFDAVTVIEQRNSKHRESYEKYMVPT
jgi:hypothetical protein